MAVILNGVQVGVGAGVKRNYTTLLEDSLTTKRTSPGIGSTQKLTAKLTATPTAGKRMQVQIFSGAIINTSATSLEDRWERVQTISEFDVDDFFSGDTDGNAGSSIGSSDDPRVVDIKVLPHLDYAGGGDGTGDDPQLWVITRRNDAGTQIGITCASWQYSNGFALRIQEF